MIHEDCLFPERELVAVYEAGVPGIDPVAWAAANRDRLRERMLESGACLLRGFRVDESTTFARFVRVFDEDLASYDYGSTPRHKEGEVYTSTEYPAGETIPLHNEMSYTTEWPRRIWFYSVVAARRGGATILGDSRAVYRRIPERIRAKLEPGVRYVRSYRRGLGLTWQEAFATEDRAKVEQFCAVRRIDFAWRPDGTLRTSEVCQAIAHHPETGDALWMNQAHLFHVSNLKAETRRALLEIVAPDDFPRNAYLADGSPLDEDDLAAIRRAYDLETLEFPWQNGDLLMVDNMRMAHGRASFEGPRKVLVAMTAPLDSLRASPSPSSQRPTALGAR